MRESADDLSKELKGLSEKIRELVPKKPRKVIYLLMLKGIPVLSLMPGHDLF